ncbi:MAG: hypothetical protein ACE14M_15095 [Terriglobales bacterium]
MLSHRITSILISLFLLGSVALADSGSQPVSSSQRMSPQTRMMVIRSLNAEFVFVRTPLPQGKDGLTIKDGVISPGAAEVQQAIVKYGPAAKPGDRAQITNVEIKDRSIRLEINGGPKKKTKWYQHIQVSGIGGTAQAPPDTSNPRGAVVELAFDKYVPEMTGDQVRQLLSPVFDFHAKSAAEAYLDTVPPKVKEAIKNHQVLVGMNREMVTYAKGRPERKIREQSNGLAYEEWLYGQPPQEVQFVRFVGDEVVRLEIMKVDGERVVRTEKEVDLSALAQNKREQPAQPRPATAPSLRRPGEAPDPDSPLASPRTPAPSSTQETEWPGKPSNSSPQ